MNNELTKTEFTSDQIQLIKNTIAKDATNDELKLFLYTAQRSGLDPLAKQIHFVKRSGKMTIQTAIDGYRLIADRTGKYAGNDDPIFDNENDPKKATVTVYKIVDGVRCGFQATARWSQYFPGDAQGFMWKKMPHLMLGKCAESLALRKAFPSELSGIYTQEEMQQADHKTQAIEVISETTVDEPFKNTPNYETANTKTCPKCNKPHQGKYPKCLNCWKSDKNEAAKDAVDVG